MKALTFLSPANSGSPVPWGSVQVPLRLYWGSTESLLRLYWGSIQALLRLYWHLPCSIRRCQLCYWHLPSSIHLCHQHLPSSIIHLCYWRSPSSIHLALFAGVISAPEERAHRGAVFLPSLCFSSPPETAPLWVLALLSCIKAYQAH